MKLATSSLQAQIRFSAMLKDGAAIVGLPRDQEKKRSASVIDMLSEFAINEHVDMEGEFAG